ncbi:hypothetical protein GW934_03245 [Candidatus Falkowbacteria bacterium]|nr:hypothetical protein [Candidatus Falkowbacteria bacterium]
MTTDKIKNKLESFITEYQGKLGTFNGSLVIYDFIEFINNDPTIEALIKDQYLYVKSQKEIILKMTDNELDSHLSSNVAFDPETPDTWPGKDVFTKEHNMACSIMKDSEPFSPTELGLPICLAYLDMIHEAVSRAKTEIQNNSDKSEKITEVIKEISTTSLPFKFKDKNDEKSLSLVLPMFCIYCLGIVNSYIFNELEKSEFLKGNQPVSAISFDLENSILYIRGQEIKITLKNDKPIDHYILEAIFSKEDLKEQTDFVEIAEDTIKEDYNGNWQRFRNACDNLNKKITKATDNKISDFIIYTTGKTGWCKINQKYL